MFVEPFFQEISILNLVDFKSNSTSEN